MIEIGIIIAVTMAIAGWIKNKTTVDNSLIPMIVVVLAVVLNLANVLLFGGDVLEAGRNAFITAIGAIGIHSGIKNSLQK